MKHFLLLFTLVTSATLGQTPCSEPNSQIDLKVNNISARILNGGDLFTDLADGKFFWNPDPNAPANPTTIYAAGLWMGGFDPAFNLKMASTTYRKVDGTDFSAGPLDLDGATDQFFCENWDKIFVVNKNEVEAFLLALPMSKEDAMANYPGVMGWPGMQNPYFYDSWGFDLPSNMKTLAPFYDADQDGRYDPLKGDHPAVMMRGIPAFLPDQVMWCVFNDEGGGAPHTSSNLQPLHAEVQLTAWAFNCPDDQVVSNTIFTSHKVIYLGAEPLDSFFVGMWVDFDLGCPYDDYAGCNPALNTMFVYNQDAVDGNNGNACSGNHATFASNPPVQTVTFLHNSSANNASLDQFLSYGLTTTPPDPFNGPAQYRLLSGSWPNGLHVTQGGDGYGGAIPVDYLFPDDPANPDGWSMCSAGLPADDRRMLGVYSKGALQPGEVLEMNTAWMVHPNNAGPCNLGNTFTGVQHLIDLHQSGYTGVCSPFTRAPVYPSDTLNLYPNPANNYSILHYGTIPVSSVELYDAAGRWLRSINTPGKEQYLLNTADLQAGVYQLRVITDANIVVKQLVVVK